MTEVAVPDIGDFEDIPVIEILVKPGDLVTGEDPLIMLESDKAVMEVPAGVAGHVTEILVSVGDTVSKGTPIARIDPAEDAGSVEEEVDSTGSAPDPVPAADASPSPPARPPDGAGPAGGEEPAHASSSPTQPPPLDAPARTPGASGAHASPSIRRFARELGVDLSEVSASGPKGRILREDVQSHVAARMRESAGASTLPNAGFPPPPKIDFAAFGEVEVVELSRIRQLSGGHLARNWSTIPHVTNFAEADITPLEELRKSLNHELAGEVKVTLLAFVIRACAAALRKFPEFNASLDGTSLVLKSYVNVGFAVDTPRGLMVPVVRAADTLGIVEIARKVSEIAGQARAGTLKPEALQGGTFSISSLGGVEGTGFTPIVNAPEVAILGLARSRIGPVWDGGQFQPRMVLPLALSWDHRAVDGAAAGRFVAEIAAILSDFRRALL